MAEILKINREDGGQTQLVANPNQPGTLMAGLTVPPPASTTLNAETIGVNPLRFPSAPSPEMPAFPTLSPDQQATPETTQPTTQPALPTTQQPTALEQERTGLMSRYQSLQEKLFGKSQAQAQAEQTQGIPQKSQAVTDMQAQINQLQNDASVAMIKAQTAGETSSFGNAQIAQIERDRTVKALQLNSFLYAAQGNLATAQSMADKAVKAQFDPIEAEINFTKEFLNMNWNDLSREDKKKADALKIQLDERKRILEEQKADKKAIMNIGTEAAEAGADSQLLNKIRNASSQEEALQIASSDPKLLSWAKTMKEQQFAADIQQQQFNQELAQQKFEEDQRQFGMTYALEQKKAGDGSGKDKLLTPTEAQTLGVPYGTTRSGAFGLKPEGELTPKQTSLALQLANSLKSHPAYTDMQDIATCLSGVQT